jgi:pilus assembly protein CpaE
MQIYIFTAGVASSELSELEDRIRSKLPSLRRLQRIEELSQPIADHGAKGEQIVVLFPMLMAGSSFDRIMSIAERDHPGVFFIFVSKDISATDYKRLVRGGGADWVSLQGAPQEIVDVISRINRAAQRSAGEEGERPSIVAFVPSGGGVGNATMAIETAVQIKTGKATRNRRICVLDLDLQTSHLSDYLDIDPRLQMKEIVDSPDRLDAQLFDLFVSQHTATGIDVLAAPRSRAEPSALNIVALDALFRRISERYDLLIIDLPPAWYEWTGQVISVCDLVVVTGLNNVPGLRQVAETLKTVRSASRAPSNVVVALNRCERHLFGGIARRQHVGRVLGREQVIYVRDDTASANHSLNTGVPIAIGNPSNGISADIRALSAVVAGLKPMEA